ncbi:MAG: YigZ family protein [Oscillospiraceae bacterium]|nr:YigZ family protein [Oscillospiraceae bacterium]
MEYKTIEGRVEARFEEKKSEFIGYLAPVENEEEAVRFIEEIRAMHRKARHNCYAYILKDGGARHSDDGEPQGTAGVPIYEVLQKEGLSGVCCVVTRYFGGVLLGAGGLVRAYTKAASDAVSAAKIKEMALAAKAEISVEYSLYGKLAKIFEELGAKTAEEKFEDNVKVTVYVREQFAKELEAKLVDACSGNVKVEFIEKEYFDFA